MNINSSINIKRVLITVLAIIVISVVSYKIYDYKQNYYTKHCNNSHDQLVNAKNIKTQETQLFTEGCIPSGWEPISISLPHTQQSNPLQLQCKDEKEYSEENRIRINNSKLKILASGISETFFKEHFCLRKLDIGELWKGENHEKVYTVLWIYENYGYKMTLTDDYDENSLPSSTFYFQKNILPPDQSKKLLFDCIKNTGETVAFYSKKNGIEKIFLGGQSFEPGANKTVEGEIDLSTGKCTSRTLYTMD